MNMHKLLLQFHVTPQELAVFLCDLIQQGLSVVIMNRVQLSIELATKAEIDSNRIQAATQIGILQRRPETSCQSWEKFLEDHHEALFLKVGKLENNVLAQSWLSSQSASEAVIQRWKKISNILRNRTAAGVWVTNPATKATAFYKQFRFSQGALALYDSGCRMVPAAGTNVIHLRTPFADPNSPPTLCC